MGKIKSFFGNWIVKNLLGAAVVLAVLVGGAAIGLNLITGHNKELTVPDLTAMKVKDAEFEAHQAGMRTEVVDSVYVKRLGRGFVYKQNPAPGAKVKKGRRIALTINAVTPKKVSMPNLVGYSMRQAKAELGTRGLLLGKLMYVSDIATNNVLRQMHGNIEIEPGTPIESESVIDLVVGLNSDDNMTSVPDVRGLKMMSAVDMIQENSLNVRKVVYDKTVQTYEDSTKAFVWKMTPEPSEQPLPMGSDVSIYLTTDLAKKPIKF